MSKISYNLHNLCLEHNINLSKKYYLFLVNTWQENMKVQIIKAHHNWIAVAYTHFVTGYR